MDGRGRSRQRSDCEGRDINPIGGETNKDIVYALLRYTTRSVSRSGVLSSLGTGRRGRGTLSTRPPPSLWNSIVKIIINKIVLTLLVCRRKFKILAHCQPPSVYTDRTFMYRDIFPRVFLGPKSTNVECSTLRKTFSE